MDGALELDGDLNVSLINGFMPQPWQSFHILDWGNLDGTFDTLSLAPLAGTLQWDTSKLYTDGILSVTLPGDHNLDGVVDILDYVYWRMNDNTPAGYDAWRGAYGEPGGSGSSVDASVDTTVPEPATLIMLIVAAVGIRLSCRHRC